MKMKKTRRRNLKINMDYTTKITYQYNNNNIIIIKTKIYKKKNIVQIKTLTMKEFRNNTICEKEKNLTKKTIKILKRKKNIKRKN